MTAKRPTGVCAWCRTRIPAHYRADRTTCSERCRGAKRRSGNPKRHLLWRYGITPDERAEILEAQHRACAICFGPEADVGTLVVDHDHRTGAIRGLLCAACNSGLGLFRDRGDFLATAILYLDRADSARP